MFASHLLFVSINNQLRSGSPSLLLLQEKMYSAFGSGLLFPPFAPFYETFNEKILWMIEGGLINLWIQNALKQRGINKKLPEIGPEVLTMEHLDIAFKIIMIVWAICILGFLAEIMFYRIKKMFKKFL